MLVMTRDYEKGNMIVIDTPSGEKIKVFLVETMKRSQARIGVEAPKGYKISREHSPKPDKNIFESNK